jgi:16S rRNA (guanine527-N7)-methyltransferase
MAWPLLRLNLMHSDESLWHDSLWLESLHWQPHSQQVQQFRQLYSLILQGNTRQNLTRILEPQEFWEKHLWDSLRGIQTLAPLSQLPATGNVIDIGTGAGFPGIPIAIAFPTWQMTLLDSTQRKIEFVRSVVTALGLPGVTAWADRVESFAHLRAQRESYDLTLCRAVAEASVCLEYSLPLLQIGGQALLYRGHWSEAEAEAVIQASAILGGQLKQVEAFTTPISQSIRHCIVVEKTISTPPQYPRAVGVPSRHPLGSAAG